MKTINKASSMFLLGILMNTLIFEQSVFADSISPTESIKQPGVLVFFGVCLVVICGIVIYNIIAVKKNK